MVRIRQSPLCGMTTPADRLACCGSLFGSALISDRRAARILIVGRLEEALAVIGLR